MCSVEEHGPTSPPRIVTNLSDTRFPGIGAVEMSKRLGHPAASMLWLRRRRHREAERPLERRFRAFRECRLWRSGFLHRKALRGRRLIGRPLRSANAEGPRPRCQVFSRCQDRQRISKGRSQPSRGVDYRQCVGRWAEYCIALGRVCQGRARYCHRL